ncbi:MarR family winged helix-turn-helix transcriptional regulator [Vibrio sp. 99-70-13A1]|uniref:MarR family winged helix-turn-helix transcriptional regulator n=1 Tax=Vibrio sp. 99-70-13A1 TaxID=2607601 RepID=UPI0020A4D018|nr:MarR family winged helix-turn-helix transcriptional regulator [Vibrio sp. 99-70-13A1]
MTLPLSIDLLKYIPWNKYYIPGNVFSRGFTRMSQNKQQLGSKLFISLGIIHQLTDAWLAKALGPHNLTQSQFNVLTHFSRHPDQAQTVSQLSDVMQMNQPGLTKVVNKLFDMGLVDIEKDADDGRKKWIKINQSGLEKVSVAYASFSPMMESCFDGWEEEEMSDTLEKINKLKGWLDSHRD